MHIALLSALCLLVCDSIGVALESRKLPRLRGLGLSGSGHDVLTTQLDLIAAAKAANFFRIPIEWGSIVRNYPASISFHSPIFAQYDRLVQAALGTGAHVMIDLHDTGRLDTAPSDEDLANLWYNFADFYQDDERIIFGIMNEPRNSDMLAWSVSVQGAINAIRSAGAVKQSIAISGRMSLSRPWINGTNAALLRIKDPSAKRSSDKSKLIIDIHEKIITKSGQCSLRQLRRLATWLDMNGRKAIISDIEEEGSESCLGDHLDYITDDDSFIGFAISARSSEPPESSIQNREISKRFMQPNLLSGSNPTRTRKRATKRNNRRQQGPSATPIPAENRQTYTGNLGTEATPVYDTQDDQSSVNGQVFARRLDAVGTSCAQQRTACLDAAAKWGYVEPLTIQNCNNQYQACLTTAVRDHETTATLAPSNLQTFTGTVGGLPPSVFPILSTFVTNGAEYTSAIFALRASCDLQAASCSQTGVSTCATQSNSCRKIADGPRSVIPAGYSQVGCLRDNVSNRVLQGASLGTSDMDQGKCVTYCRDRNFAYAGLEFGSECYCSSVLQGQTTYLDSSQCNTPCINNANEICGGTAVLTLFRNPAYLPTTNLPARWSANGCVTEATSMRALSGSYILSSDMTPYKCAFECQKGGFKYAGAEFGAECYCGNSWNAGSVPAAAGECATPCAGDSSKVCGGAQRLTTWVFT